MKAAIARKGRSCRAPGRRHASNVYRHLTKGCAMNHTSTPVIRISTARDQRRHQAPAGNDHLTIFANLITIRPLRGAAATTGTAPAATIIGAKRTRCTSGGLGSGQNDRCHLTSNERDMPRRLAVDDRRLQALDRDLELFIVRPAPRPVSTTQPAANASIPPGNRNRVTFAQDANVPPAPTSRHSGNATGGLHRSA